MQVFWLLLALGSMLSWPGGADALKSGLIAGSSRPTAAAVWTAAAKGNRAHPRSCTVQQRIAQDVLAYVASEPQKPTQQRQLRRRLTNAIIISNSSSSNLHTYVQHLAAPEPPQAWWQLCRAVAASGEAGLAAALAADKAVLPDVQGAAAAHCSLARHPWAHTFKDPALSAFVASLFLSIVRGRAAAAAKLHAPAPLLDRFDLWHGHLFVAYDCDSNSDNSSRSQLAAGQAGRSRNSTANGAATPARTQHQQPSMALHAGSTSSGGCSGGCSRHSNVNVGILFHAAEYPAYDPVRFPVPLGFCQANSSLRFNQRAMDLRNILWWKGRLAVLDVGTRSPLNKLLLHEGTRLLRTLYEEDFGWPVGDLLMLPPPRKRRRRGLAADQAAWLRALDASGPAEMARKLAEMQQAVFVSY